MADILAVDDEKAILFIIKQALEKEGHRVVISDQPMEIAQMERLPYDLILLDIMMPGLDGFELCRQIRERADCPILFLTAKTLEQDMVKGLNIGGDDYITKPFGIGELRARVAAHLRRERREKKQAMKTGGLIFWLLTKEVCWKEERMNLTKKEYEICELLALHPGQVFSKERIYEHVYGYDADSEIAGITEHIKNIRNKLSHTGCSPIETVWGMGYRWKNSENR